MIDFSSGLGRQQGLQHPVQFLVHAPGLDFDLRFEVCPHLVNPLV